MKRLFVSAILSMVAVLGLTLDSQANGLFRRHRDCESCGAPCATSCATAPIAAPSQFVEQKVIRYKQKFVEKEIEQIVCKRVTHEEKYFFNVQVPVTKQEPRKVTTYKTIQTEVPYDYTVCVPVTVTEKRKVTTYKTVQNEVPYEYTVLVPKTVTKVVKQTTYKCIPETVTETRSVCKLVRVTCTDECGRCYTRCERVTVLEPVTRCIVKRVPVVQDVTINEVVCEPKIQKGKKIVCAVVSEVKEVDVNVCRVENKAMKGKKIVCSVVPVVSDVLVNVCTYVTEKREGKRLVCEIVSQKVKTKVQVCQLEPYEEIIRVQVGAACSTCDDCGTRSHSGLFRRNR
jgi:hypothetical protein